MALIIAPPRDPLPFAGLGAVLKPNLADQPGRASLLEAREDPRFPMLVVTGSSVTPVSTTPPGCSISIPLRYSA
jgi:hypothetical protein